MKIKRIDFDGLMFFVYFSVMLNLYTYTYIQLIAQMMFVGWIFLKVNTSLLKINTLTKRYIQWYGLFVTWAMLSLLWTKHALFDGAREPLTLIRIFVVGYCVLLYLINKNVIVVFRSFCYAGVLFIIISIINNPISAFGNEAFVSFGTGFVRTGIAEICLNFVLGVYLFFKMGQIKKKEFYFLITCFLIGIGLTGARKQVFELILFVVLLWVFSHRVSLGFAKKMIVLTIVFVLICLFFPSEVWAKINKFIQMFVGRHGTDASADGRWTYIIEAIKLSKSHPFIGSGIDAFKNYLSSHIVKTRFGILQSTYSHCNYTELLVSFGIVGIAIWYSYHAQIIRENWEKRMESVPCTLICIVVTFLIGDIGAIVYSTHIIVYFYVILLYISTSKNNNI